MSNESLASWKLDVANLVVGEIPFQTLETALALVDSYLAATGGWNPDDASDPTGPGQPVSGETQAEAAASIRDLLLQRTQDFVAEASVRIRFHYFDNFSFCDGDDRQQAIDAMRTKFKEFIEFQLGTGRLEFIELDSYEADFTNTGYTTEEVRVEIQSTIVAGGQMVDPRAIALSAARALWGLDSTWNIRYGYIQENQELFFEIRKYLTDSYQDVDPSAERKYTIKLDPWRYTVVGGSNVIL